MQDLLRKNQEIIQENALLKQRIQELERTVAAHEQGEEALRISELRYQTIFETTGTAMVIIEEDMTISLANDRFEGLTGYKREEVEGKRKWTEFVEKNDLERMVIQHQLRRADPGLAAKSYEFRLVHRDGGLKNILLTIDIIPGSKRSVASLLDITDRMQAEEKLRESERKYHELYDFLPIPIYEIDLEANIVSANRAVYETFGGTEADLKRGFKAWQILLPEDMDKAAQNIQRLIKGGRTGRTEYTLKRLDGSVFPAIIISSAIRRAGKIVGIRGAVVDITENRHQEEELRRVTAFLDSIVENIPDMIFVKDAGDLRFVRFNRAGEELLGYSRNDLLGKNDYDFFTPEQADFFTENDRNVLNEGRIVDIPEEPIQTRNRGERILRTKKVPILGVNGEPEFLLGISEDITDRKRAEKALQESKNRLKEAQKMAHLGFWYWDVKTGDVEWSEEVFKIFRLDPKEFTPHIDSILALSPWEENHQRGQELIERAIESHEQGSYEQKFLRPDKSIGYYCSTFQGNYDENGDLVSIFGTALDITDRKRAEKALQESEAELQTIFNNVGTGILIIDSATQVIIEANQAAVEMAGQTKERIIGQICHSLVCPAEAGKCPVKDLGQHIDQSERKLIHADGRQKDILKTVYPISIKGRDCYLESFIDISDRLRAEKLLKESEARLQRAEKMEALGTLAGGVAHDLNNVLGVIVGYAELLLSSVDKSSPIRPRLEHIMKGGERAAAIVQDLLTLARRGVSGRQVLNLNQIISDFQLSPEYQNLSLHHTSARIKTDLEPDLLNISGSPVHLVKTLFNLVSNSIESMPTGGMVTIKTANQYLDKPIQGYDEVREGDYVVLSVSDTGEGISADDLKHIFEPFYTKKVMGRSGTGLGLAVVWGTVKDHHGYINVQSEEGKGSLFTLYFPVTREDISSEAVSVSVSEYTGRGESILIVDDVEEQRALAAEMLRRLNYNVKDVSSGEAAVAYLKEHRVDLIVLDMIMDPGMDGLDTYRSVLEIRPKQKAIIVSGFSETDRVDAARALGAGAYVRKPYVIEKLGLAVRKELDRK